MTDTLDIDAIRERHRSLNDEALRRIAASDDAAWNPQVRALAREELAARGIAAPSPVVAPTTATTDAEGRVEVAGLPGEYVVEAHGTRTELEVGDDADEVIVVVR